MMRVAYVCADPGVPVFGRKGNSVHVQEVVRALMRQGAEVDLFATRLGGGPLPGLKKARVHALPRLPKGDPAVREKAALATNEDLRAALGGAGRFDLVYERYSLWSFAGMEYAQEAAVPAMLEVNAPLIEEQAEHRSLVDRAVAEGVADRAFAAASALIAVSREVASYLEERYPFVDGRVCQISNGVDPARFPENLEPSLPAPAGTFTVGFVGTLKPWHGLPQLVEAFDMLHTHDPDARLLVVGDGPGRGRLEEDLARRGLSEAAHLTGAVGPEEVPPLLASMDAAVAPYPEQANFYFSPLKVYVYMAAGLPVVASRVGQLEELIAGGENGLLISPGDPVSLAVALDWLRQDPKLGSQLGEAAREAVLQHHTWDAVARRILSLAGLEKESLVPEVVSR